MFEGTAGAPLLLTMSRRYWTTWNPVEKPVASLGASWLVPLKGMYSVKGPPSLAFSQTYP